MQVREMVLQEERRPQPTQQEVYHITGTGDRIHWRRSCFGLRNATARGMRAAVPCTHCWPGGQVQQRRGFWSRKADFHEAYCE